MQAAKQHKRKGHLIHNIYCPTAEKTMALCQLEFSLFPQQPIYFEVPFEQFEEVIQHFPQSELVKRGAFTYQQVQHIAQTGNIHHLAIAADGRVYFKEETIGMSSAIAFAQSKWNGATREEAIENAVLTGLSIIGESFAEEIIEAQLQLEVRMNAVQLQSSMLEKIRKNGSKAVIKKVASAATNKAMYSSAVAKKAIMLVNANVVTGALVTGAMSTVDITRAIKGQISPLQLFKNISKTAASVAGSIGGLLIGGAIGINMPSISFIQGSLIGGLTGLVLGSLVMTRLAQTILDLFIAEDSSKMLEIFNEQLIQEAQQYLVSEQELAHVVNDLNELYNVAQELRNMYAAQDREAFARAIIQQELSRIVKQRMYLQVPTNQELFQVMEQLKGVE